MVPRASCRRSRRHPRPGQARAIRGLRAPQAVPGPRGSPVRRALRPPRRTSGVREPVRLAPRLRGPAARRGLRRPAGPGVLGPSVPLALRAGRISRLREPDRGQPRRGRQVRVRPVRVVRPGQPERAPGPVARVPARGQVTIRSAPPRPVWARRLRPGPRRPARPVSRLQLAARDSLRVPPAVPRAPAEPAAPAGLPVLVQVDADRAGPAGPMAVRVLAVRVREVPGLAR
jgi:hypothetical protein